MVRLDKLIMQNFKSFSGKVTIPFPSGFVVIAGANGSGKSNIIDAINFVLGVTSARHIRAQKLQNLIFNGARNKKQADFCEVMIELDNNDGKIPGEDKTISVTRRITKSGISIYKLNGQTVTRTKILDLIANAGMSPEGYNIIKQGDVSKIVEMNPNKRREIIDDISGITEFNEKKNQSIQKLEKITTRVREAMIVISEKTKRVTQLKIEKENAEKYQDLNNDLRKATASLIKRNIETSESEISKIKQDVNTFTKESGSAQKDLQSFEKTVEKQEMEFKKFSESLMNSKSIDIVRNIEKIRSEILRKKDRIETLEDRILSSRRTETDFSIRLPVEATKFSSTIKTPDQYSIAIQAAVGSHSRDLIVKNFDDGITAIKFLREKRIGKARFIPLDRIHQKNGKMIYQPGVIGLAIDLIDFNQKYLPAINYVLGDTLIIENLDVARKINNIRCVTLEGDLVERSGAMIGGWKEKRRMFVSNINSLENEKSALLHEITQLEIQLGSMEKMEHKESKNIENAKTKIQESEKNLQDIRKKRKELTDMIFTIGNQVNNRRIERAKLETKLDDLNTQKKQYKNVTEYYDLPSEELEVKIRHSLIEIRKLGPVNMKAIEEYSSISVEFEEMRKKLDKLLEEKDSIMKTIEAIENHRTEKFTKTLEELNGYFKRIYEDMSDGIGNLRLENPNNVDSGLIIEASPAGKRVLDLDVMSGGEKTMTSLAFLFAIMQHFASPFYILDEVDAALDKINTQKISNLVKKYSKNIQFIVISHNDITMSHADKVFGVAMEDGASKVFGVDLPKR
ncbi:MAG: chromosome segregation SMC family protein [Candidatus Aenigmatarchaeota archaeon]